MPEIGEVARIVHYLRKHLVHRTIKACEAFEDDIVYGKVGTSASAFQKAVTGRKVTGAAQQGKYFYITFDQPPHTVCHLGMTGWIKFNAEETGYYKQAVKKDAVDEWPPKYMKFLLKCDKEKIDGEEREPLEVAFIDARRLARIRLVDCEADDIRNHSPLKENGPDPVRDKEIVTVDWLAKLLRKKRVPVKALLLDQANLSGVGNWVADEILYQARLHPEQYSNTFSDDQVKQLHDALMHVCGLAVEVLADSTKFPDDWIMKYRWNKGKKDSNVLPNGEKIVHLTVGGRTSAIVPTRQKKTAEVAGDVSAGDLEDADEKPTKSKKRKALKEESSDELEEEDSPEKRAARAKKFGTKQTNGETKKSGRGRGKAATNGVNGEVPAVAGAAEVDALAEKPKPSKKSKSNATASTPKKQVAAKPPTPGSRRSTRNKN